MVRPGLAAAGAGAGGAAVAGDEDVDAPTGGFDTITRGCGATAGVAGFCAGERIDGIRSERGGSPADGAGSTGAISRRERGVAAAVPLDAGTSRFLRGTGNTRHAAGAGRAAAGRDGFAGAGVSDCGGDRTGTLSQGSFRCTMLRVLTSKRARPKARAATHQMTSESPKLIGACGTSDVIFGKCPDDAGLSRGNPTLGFISRAGIPGSRPLSASGSADRKQAAAGTARCCAASGRRPRQGGWSRRFG